MTITLTIDNQYVRIDGAGLKTLRALDRVSSYRVAGHRFSPAYKSHRWDGKEHLLKYSREHGYRVPSGMAETIARELVRLEERYRVVFATEFHSERRELPWNPEIELRDYQNSAVKAILGKPVPGRGVLKMAIRSGKTNTAARVIKAIGRAALFVVPSKWLLHQTIATLKRCLPGVPIGQIGDGVYDPQFITVSTIQTLSGMSPVQKSRKSQGRKAHPEYNKLMKQFDLAIFDECFVAGTLVDGRPIEKIKLGDHVTSFDERMRPTRRRVTRIYKNPAYRLVEVFFADGRRLVCTPNHPIRTRFEWKNADELEPNDFVYAVRTGWFRNLMMRFGILRYPKFECVRVSRVQRLPGSFDRTFNGAAPDGNVYNLEVEGTHTYLANGIAVHNCHHIRGTGEWYRVFVDLDARFKIGLSATVFFDNESEQESGIIWLRATCGSIRYEVTPTDLIEKGFLLKQTVRMYRVKTPVTKEKWSASLKKKCITANAARNLLIAKIVGAYTHKKKPAKTIVIAREHDHIRAIATALEDAGVEYRILTGGTPQEVRMEMVNDFLAGEFHVMIGNVLGEGVDIPAVEVVVNAEGGRDEKQAWQRQRNLTVDGSDKRPVLIDFYDEMSPIFRKHSDARLSVYQSEEAFDVKVVEWRSGEI